MHSQASEMQEDGLISVGYGVTDNAIMVSQ